MKTLVYETKVDSRASLRDRIFGAAEHISNHPDIIASATQYLLMHAENCIASGGGHFEKLLYAGTVFYYSYVVGLYQNAQSTMLRQ